MPVFLSENNLVNSFLGKVRNKDSDNYLFRNNIKKITIALALEAQKEFSIEQELVTTPICDCQIKKLSESIIVVPILRSGLIMSEALQFLFEECVTMHLGIYRDESLNAIKYYDKIPNNLDKKQKIILCDPLIATACTVLKALEILTKYNHKNIFIISVIISKRAIELINEKYPNVNIYVAAIDPEINSRGYIVPGVGDAGDRLFQTK